MSRSRETNGLVTIGRAAKAVGVAASVLRYYEKQGLLAPSAKAASGYRMYGADELERLRFIRSAQAVGFTLDGIRTLLDLDWEDSKPCRAAVQRVLEQRLAEVDVKINDLKRIRGTLARALDRCRHSKGKCAVLKELSSSKNRRRTR